MRCQSARRMVEEIVSECGECVRELYCREHRHRRSPWPSVGTP